MALKRKFGRASAHCRVSVPGNWSLPPTLAVPTLQSAEVWHKLDTTGRVMAHWRNVGNIRPVYEQMVELMRSSGIGILNHPPMWGWPSDAAFGGVEPNMTNASGWLPDVELRRGIRVIELEVPRRLCLISQYNSWCALISVAIGPSEYEAEMLALPEAELFGFPSRRCEAADGWGGPGGYQVCMPHLDRGWVRKVQVLRGTAHVGPNHGNKQLTS